MSGLVLGVDGGGTKTIAATAAADGSLTWHEYGPGLDPSSGDGWRDGIARLAAAVPGSSGTLAAAAFGLPLHGEAAAFTTAQVAAVTSCFAGPAIVENDVRIAFDGAFAGGPGALVLSGTGSMAWASLAGPEDPHVRVGGWGELFGDEGSAHWIGRESLALLSRHLDGRAAVAPFAHGLLAVIGIAAADLPAWWLGLPNRRQSVAALARPVAAMADADDPDALRILDRAAGELAEQLVAAWWRCSGGALPAWSFAGSVFNSAVLRRRMEGRVGLAPQPPRLPPVGGALLRAARLAGWPIDTAWIDRLAHNLGAITRQQA